MAALMMLLLPTLLLAMAPQKLTGLPLSVPGPSEELPPLPPGPVESIEVQITSVGAILSAEIRATDVRATTGDTETKQWNLTRPQDVQPVLRGLKKLDPERTRLRLIPDPSSTTADVVYWMDIVRNDVDGELYPNVVVDSQ